MIGENIAFTERAIRKLQSLGPRDAMTPPLISYLRQMGRLFIGPGDMWWIAMPNRQPAQVCVPLVPAAPSSNNGESE
jgi:hypothetical protein